MNSHIRNHTTTDADSRRVVSEKINLTQNTFSKDRDTQTVTVTDKMCRARDVPLQSNRKFFCVQLCKLLRHLQIEKEHTKSSQSMCRVIKCCTEINLFHAITMYLVITLCDASLYCFLTVLKGVNGAVGSRNKATVFHG